MVPSGASEGESVCLIVFPASGGCLQALVSPGLWLPHSSLGLHRHPAFSSVSLCANFPLFIRTPVIGLGPWFMTLTSCSVSAASMTTGRLINPNLIASAKAQIRCRSRWDCGPGRVFWADHSSGHGRWNLRLISPRARCCTVLTDRSRRPCPRGAAGLRAERGQPLGFPGLRSVQARVGKWWPTGSARGALSVPTLPPCVRADWP